MSFLPVLLASVLTAESATEAAAAARCADTPSANRQLVVDFYTQALVTKQVRAGFERYVRPDFVEHKSDVPGGDREQVIQYLETMVKELPGARWTILRTVADGDLVALHARFAPAEGAPEYAIADFFRIKDCKIAEHWDVVAAPPKDSINPNPRF